jgi:hypothetical protein
MQVRRLLEPQIYSSSPRRLTHADDGLDLPCAKSRKQIAFHRSRMNLSRRVQLRPSLLCQNDEDGSRVGFTLLRDFNGSRKKTHAVRPL